MRARPGPHFRIGTAVIASLALLAPSLAVADEIPLRRINIVQVSWPGAAEPSTTASTVADVIRTDTIDRWKRISDGRVLFTLDATLPNVRTTDPLPCDALASVHYLSSVTLAAYQQAGISDFDHRYLVIVAPDPGTCVWAGRGVVNPPGSSSGMLVLKDTADPMVIAHELGHNLGLGHSNLERCVNRVDGPWKDCTAVEYGSATDLMGNTLRDSPLSVYHQWRLGWVPDRDVAVGNRNISVTLQPVDTRTGTRAIFVRDQSAAYWIELRRADPANGVARGLVIYRSDPPPASSVVSPIGDAKEITSRAPGIDVWMINLGDYVYGSGGSPTLAPDTAFTTTFGGATIVAHMNADGSADVRVTRSGSASPAPPTWTAPSTWRNAAVPVIAPDLDDRGVDIDRFEARITEGAVTSVISLPRTASPLAERTYRNPVSEPAVVVAGSLPEGRYSAQIRAVNVFGVAGAWSISRSVHIDRGTPRVTPRVRIESATAKSVTVAWSGARDPGSGICSAQVLNADGFALARWRQVRPAIPTFALATEGRVAGTAQVFDCLGNGRAGELTLSTSFSPASAFSRSDLRGSRVPCPDANCVARVQTGPGEHALLVGAGSGLVFVDGRLVARIASGTAGIRIAARVSGSHALRVEGTVELRGLQTAAATFRKGVAVSGTVHTADHSLSNSTQRQLARLGFSQADFSDAQQVAVMAGGDTTTSATLDFCAGRYQSEGFRTARRQVTVEQEGNPYVFLSTETVRYSSRAAVLQAIAELDVAAGVCRSRGYAQTGAGAKQPYTFGELPNLPTSLRPAHDRRIYLVTTGESTTATTLLIAYQFRGDTLNALYVGKRGVFSLDDATLSRWLDVAAILAQRLNSHVRV